MPRPDLTAQSGNWKALLISPNKELIGELTPLLAQFLPRTPLFEMQSYPARRALGELGGSQGPNLCFLDVLTDTERAIALIGELLSVQPMMKIFVVLSSKHPDMILRAMRQGAAEFLVRPFDPDQLEHAIARIVTLHAGEAGGLAETGRIISVFPAKGASGASVLAANLAHQFKRNGKKKVLLADMDPLTGTLSFLLKLKSNYSFLDALSRSTSLDIDIWKGIVTPFGGIDVLLSPETVQDSLHELRDASTITEFARTAYDVAIMDTGSVFGEWNLTLARSSDDVVLVTTNELPSLQAAQKVIAFLESNQVSSARIRLVVNRYNKEYGLSREVIETALHCDVYHVLPSDYDAVHNALLAGKSVPPGSAFGKGIAQLADLLIPPVRTSSESSRKSSALSGILSLFSRTS
jgi:pilus assembly protein CpaE